MNTIFRNSAFPILVILSLSLLARLHQFSSPVADWHSWRQADTSAVSRNFLTRGIDILHPRFDDLSNVASKIDNPQGYRFVEFPLYNLFQAGLYQVIGIFSLEEWGRIVSITASLLSGYFLYLIMKKRANKEVGLLTAFFYLFFPFNIYYGRTILPDPSMVAAILGGIYFFDRWVDEKSTARGLGKLFLATLFTASALLLKPYALFFTLPMLYIAWKAWGFSLIRKWQLWMFLILSVAPLLLWRQWMLQFPEGIPANLWLLNEDGIRFRPAFFRWMVYERLMKLLSGYAAIIFLPLGLYQAFRIKHTGFFLSFLISSLLYVSVFAAGNVRHDYYQILIMPSLAVIYGLGGYFLLNYFKKKNQLIGPLLFVLITSISFFFSWNIVKDYFNINNREMIEAGKAVDTLTPKDAKVIALYGGDTSFLYQTNRQGWANFQNPLPVMIRKGATHLVQIHPNQGDIALYRREYDIVASTSGYILVKLK